MRRAEAAADALKPANEADKNQRLVLVAAAIVAVLGAVLLAMWGLKDRAAYFYTPADIAAGKAARARRCASAEWSSAGSIQRAGGRRHHPLRRRRTGRRARQSSIAASCPTCSAKAAASSPKGKLQPTARSSRTHILAKHDERYMPPELGNLAAEHKAGKTLER